jgi:hypothetical protein
MHPSGRRCVTFAALAAGISAIVDHERGRGVAQALKGQRRESRLLHRRAPHPRAEVVVAQKPPFGAENTHTSTGWLER